MAKFVEGRRDPRSSAALLDQSKNDALYLIYFSYPKQHLKNVYLHRIQHLFVFIK